MADNLPDRLVQAVAAALEEAAEISVESEGLVTVDGELDAMSGAAAVAVLRTLDEWYWNHDSSLEQHDAGALADEIENSKTDV